MEEYQMKIMGQGNKRFFRNNVKRNRIFKAKSTRSQNALQMADVKTIGAINRND